MSWTYRYRGVDDAGLDSEWDKVKGPKSSPKPTKWTIAEMARIKEEARRQSQIPTIKEVDDIPVRGRWDYLSGCRYYLDRVIDFGVVGRRCYLTVSIMGKVHNVHVPDSVAWDWLKSAVIKKDGSGNDK